MMKYVVAVFLLTGCGYTSVDNELVGQVKKIHHNTPIVCPNYYTVDVSMGVMRNGTGSMSTHDMSLTVEGSDLVKFLTEANANGKLVKVKYKVARVVWCIDEEIVDSADYAE